MARAYMHHLIFKHHTGTLQDTLRVMAKCGKIAMTQ
jgi:hypothetical protein